MSKTKYQTSDSISLVFPVLNDAETLKNLMEKSLTTLKEVADDFEIIVIDDGSVDDTWQILSELAQTHSQLKVLKNDGVQGYGSAIKKAFKMASKDWIVQIDGDDEYDIRELVKMIPLLKFYDLIVTFRYVKMYSNFRILLSFVYNALIRFIFKSPFRDVSTGFKVFRRALLDDIKLHSSSSFIGAELTIKTMINGYRIGEVGIQMHQRKFGTSNTLKFKNIKMSISELFRCRNEVYSKKYGMRYDRE